MLYLIIMAPKAEQCGALGWVHTVELHTENLTSLHIPLVWMGNPQCSWHSEIPHLLWQVTLMRIPRQTAEARISPINLGQNCGKIHCYISISARKNICVNPFGGCWLRSAVLLISCLSCWTVLQEAEIVGAVCRLLTIELVYLFFWKSQWPQCSLHVTGNIEASLHGEDPVKQLLVVSDTVMKV